MKKLGKIFTLCILATFFAGSAMAVSLAPNGVGDVLIFPNFIADGTGWETDLKVINTKTDQSVVAKVVISGGENSTELLDFFIYLSPTDVWTGKIYNDNGTVKIYSDDDSIRSGGTEQSPIWADVTPVDEPLRQPDCETTFYGYVEVFEAWNSAATTTAADLSSPPVDKDDIFAVYNSFPSFGAEVNFDTVQNEDAIANALTGYYEFNLPTMGFSASEKALAFMDYDVNEKLELGRLTFLGESSDTTIAEIETWLAKTFVYMPYYNDGVRGGAHLFTFPTKTALTDADCSVVGTRSGSPFFAQLPADAGYCVEYGMFDTNHEELTPGGDPDPIFSPVPDEKKRWMCYEWNALLPALENYDWNWDEGYVRYVFEETTTVTVDGTPVWSFSGAPTIPTVVQLGQDGLSLVSASYDFGTVVQY